MTPFDGKCQNLEKTNYIFALALANSDILTIKMFDLQKVGQGYGVWFSQWHHSMKNVKSYKRPTHFALAFIVSVILAFKIVDVIK